MEQERTYALEIKERCRDCTFFHKFKWRENGAWFYRDCCTALADGSGRYENFVLAVESHDFCEMFLDRDEYREMKR